MNDAPTGSVTIDGTAEQGETLTANVSDVADADGLGTFSYAWFADGVAIDGATSSTLVLTQDQVGKVITVTASYEDGQGTAESVTSAATDPVENVDDAPTAVVLSWTGDDPATPAVNEVSTLGVITAAITDVDGGDPSAIAIGWEVSFNGTDWIEAEDAGGPITGDTFTPTAADVGLQVRAVVTWTNPADANDVIVLRSEPTPAVWGVDNGNWYMNVFDADGLLVRQDFTDRDANDDWTTTVFTYVDEVLDTALITYDADQPWSTQLVQYGVDGQIQTATYTGPASGTYSGVTVVNTFASGVLITSLWSDTGNTQNADTFLYSYTNGQPETVLITFDDGQPWSTQLGQYDDSGAIVSWTYTGADGGPYEGVEVVNTFENGVLVSSVWTDASDVLPETSYAYRYVNGVADTVLVTYDQGEPWSTILGQFDASGQIVQWTFTGAEGGPFDGLSAVNTYANNVQTRSVWSDDANTQSWSTIEYLYDSNGVATQQITTYDEGGPFTSTRYLLNANGDILETRDTLSGSGDVIVTGSAGAQTFSGTSAAEEYRIAEGVDTVTNFGSNDTLAINASVFGLDPANGVVFDLDASVPGEAAAGEFFYDPASHQLWIGGETGPILVVTLDDSATPPTTANVSLI